MTRKKNQRIKVAGLILSCAIIAACDRNFENPVGDEDYNSGTADFSKFVTIGDSLTAGYADGALYLDGQKNSYPAILAQQFAKVGGGAFNQPLVSDNLGGLLFGGVANPDFGNRLVLNAEPKNPPSNLDPKGPEPIAGTPTTEVIGSGLNGSVFNNMGVPGAKSFHLAAANYGDATGLGAGTANPYFVRFSSAAGTTMIADAAAQQPSFFILWIGNNDILSYATTGGIGTDQKSNTNPSTYGSNDITDPAAFAGVYNGLVTILTPANASAKGVLLNIPDVSTLPYFTTVPYNAVPLDQLNAEALNNNLYADYNEGVQTALGGTEEGDAEVIKRKITFTAGQNAVVIEDDTLTDLSGVGLASMRQATATDLLILTTSSKIGTLANPGNANSAWGLGVPLEDGDVLIPSEIQAIETARTAFNTTIAAAADADPDLILVDVAAIMNEVKTSGINYGTGFIDGTYATGGTFSLDGVHPTARGYSVVANRIIDKINSSFGANIPPVDPGSYSTIFVK